MADKSISTKLAPQCPIRTTLDLVGGKWRLLIIQSLATRGMGRFRDIKRDIPEISDKVLADELRTMEESHLIARIEKEGNMILYSLKHLGNEAHSLIEPMARFGQVYKNEIGL